MGDSYHAGFGGDAEWPPTCFGGDADDPDVGQKSFNEKSKKIYCTICGQKYIWGVSKRPKENHYCPICEKYTIFS